MYSIQQLFNRWAEAELSLISEFGTSRADEDADRQKLYEKAATFAKKHKLKMPPDLKPAKPQQHGGYLHLP